MWSFLLWGCVLFSTLAQAEPIITDSLQLEELSQKFRKNKFFLKRGPIKYEISSFDIGGPETPYYLKNDLPHRYYRYVDKCFEVSVRENINLARRVRCLDKRQELFLDGFEDFKVTQIDDLIAAGLKSFRPFYFDQSFELLAYVHTYDVYSMDRAIFGPEIDQVAPRRKFSVHFSGLSEVTLDQRGLELGQKLTLKAGKIGILSERIAESINSIKLERGGLIFTNGQGVVLIYNPYVKHPFGNYELALNSKLPQFLFSLEEQSQQSPVCFRDNLISPGPNDCHKMIFGTHSRGSYKKIKILMLDFVHQSVKFIY